MSYTSDDTAPLMENIDKTLTLLGTPMAAIHEAMWNPPTSGASREAIEKKNDILEALSSALIVHKDNIKGALEEIWTELQQTSQAKWEFERIDILPDALILFADVIEKANQYFEFKTSAKEKYNFKYSDFSHACELSDALFHDEQLKLKFNKIGQSEIQSAGYAIYGELADERYGRVGEDMSRETSPSDWIFNLVFKAREKGYIMEQNPMLELEKLMKSDDFVYDSYFLGYSEPLVKATESLTKKAHEKYSQFLKDVRAYRGTKLTVEKAEDVVKPKESRVETKRGN